MYTLTLTLNERKAIDWVGDRYGHGHDLYKLIFVGGCESDPPEADWDHPTDVSFAISEHVAWQIQQIGEECEYRWDCFSPEFANKLNSFCDKIV